MSNILTTFPTAFFLFSAVSQLERQWRSERACLALGASSLTIYCMHPMIVEVLLPLIDNSVLLFLITAALSTAVSLGAVFVRDRLKKKKAAE